MIERRWVVDASPLIFLAQIDALTLLEQLADEVLVPFSVRDEVFAKKGQKPPFELPDWMSVLDDYEGRQCARALGVPVTGTLGVILRAKKAKLIPAARPLLEELLRTGLYLSRELLEQALREVNE